MKDITLAIDNLKSKRKIFHSEDDLKFAFSLSLKEVFPDYQIRLEKPEEITMENRNNKSVVVRAPIDIILIKDGIHVPIELKYKTKLFKLNHNDEQFNLTNHGATDIGRFSFRKDIVRIEKYLSKDNKFNQGFVFILTNENDYYRNIEKENKLDSNFSFHDNCILIKEDKSWNYEALIENRYIFIKDKNVWKYNNSDKLHWSCKGELHFKLPLMNEYKILWCDYSKFDKTEFKYCLIPVIKQQSG